MLNKSQIHVTLSQNHMATTFHFTLAVFPKDRRRAEACLSECHSLVAQIETELTEFREGSAVHRLNQSPLLIPVLLPSSVLELLSLSEHLEEVTRGSFSVMAKGGTSLRKGLSLKRVSKTAMRLNERAVLSFGAIGKGYALDRVRAIVTDWGFNDFLLNAGGSSLLISGSASPCSPWHIGWSADGVLPAIVLTHWSRTPIALGISGISEQGFHILDPQTQKPVTHAKSSLVSHPSAAFADALSTALFVMGWETALPCFENLTQKPGLALIDDTDKISWNGFHQNLWGTIH